VEERSALPADWAAAAETRWPLAKEEETQEKTEEAVAAEALAAGTSA
jgi:hypothetical protein